MNNFLFYNPTRIRFGRGRIAELRKEIPADARVLITYGGGSVEKNGVLDQVREALKDYQTFLFSGIEANPEYETLLKAVGMVKRERLSYLLAVGGGSVIDGTKFIAAAAQYTGDPWEIILNSGAGLKSALPLGVVVTLSASGSEMNSTAVISRASTRDKLPIFSNVIYPRFAILDPSSTFSLPARQTSNGIVDNFVHVIEQYLTYPVDGKIQDRFAESLLLTLIEEGPRALAEPDNYDVRANLMWCATLGLNGLIGAGVPQDWSTHMIGQEITAQFGIDHARTLAIILPSMLYLRRQEKREKLLQYAQRVWQISEGDEGEKIDQAIECTRRFFESLGVRTRLSDYGLGKDSIPLIIRKLKEHRMTKLGEHRDITPELAGSALELSI